MYVRGVTSFGTQMSHISNKNTASNYWALSRCQALFGKLSTTDLLNPDSTSTKAIAVSSLNEKTKIHSSKQQTQHLNPGCLTPEPNFLATSLQCIS